MDYEDSFQVDDPNERRRALLNGMEGSDIPGPDGTGGLAGGKIDLSGGITTQPVKPSVPGDVTGSALPGGSDPGALVDRAGTAPPAPDKFAAPKGDWNDPKFIAQAMQQANDVAYGYNKHTDPNYWVQQMPGLIQRGQQLNDPDYAWKRMIGMGAGPQDAAKFGQWAGGDPNAEKLGGGGQQGGPAMSMGGTAQPFNIDQVQGLDLNSILGELQALIAGQSSPSNRSALLSQLQG